MIIRNSNIFIVIILIIIFSTIFKKRIKQKDFNSKDNEFIEKIKKDIVLGKTVELKDLPIKELKKLLDEMSNNSEITDKTYNEVHIALQELEMKSEKIQRK